MDKCAKDNDVSYAWGVVKGLAYYQVWSASPGGQQQRVEAIEHQVRQQQYSSRKGSGGGKGRR